MRNKNNNNNNNNRQTFFSDMLWKDISRKL
jgi:hypothetical protein